MTKELRFQQLRRASGFTSQEVATQAGISLGEEYAFEIGCNVAPAIKEKVVQAFAHLTHHPYTLKDFEPDALTSQETVTVPAIPKALRGKGNERKYLH